MKILKASILVILLSFSLYAQKVLTLDDALSIALKESYGIKAAEYNLTSSQRNLEAFKRGLMTSINLELDAPNYSHRIINNFNPQTGTNDFFDFGFTTYEGRLIFTQPVVATNGTFTLSGTLWKREQFKSDIDYPTDYYSNLILGFRQPLFTFNTQKASLKRAEINLQKSERNFGKAEREVIYSVTSAFFRLYQLKKNVEIKAEKVIQTESSYKLAFSKFKAGLIAEVEALQLEVDLAADKNSLLDSERSFKEAKDDFKILIGIRLDEEFDVTADIKFAPLTPDVDEAVQYALSSRAELLNAESDIQLRDLNLDEVDSRGNISATIIASYGINKNDDLFRGVFYEFAKDRSVILRLNVPILDWGRNSREVEAAEAELNLSKLDYANQRQNIEKEIRAIVNKIESAKARVEVLSRTVEIAEKSYDISMQRFESGNITSFDLSQMQLKLTDAKINSLNALIDYNLAVADLERKTLKDY